MYEREKMKLFVIMDQTGRNNFEMILFQNAASHLLSACNESAIRRCSCRAIYVEHE